MATATLQNEMILNIPYTDPYLSLDKSLIFWEQDVHSILNFNFV